MKRKKIIYIISALLLAVSLLPLQPLVSFAARAEEGKMIPLKSSEAGLESENPFLYEDDSKEEGAEEIQIPDTEKAETELVAEISEEGPKDVINDNAIIQYDNKDLNSLSETEEPVEIELNKPYSGEISSDNTSDRYKIILKEAGRIYFYNTTYGGQTPVWIDCDQATVYGFLHDMYADLMAGEYVFEIQEDGYEGRKDSSHGVYTFSIGFVSANESFQDEDYYLITHDCKLDHDYSGQIAETYSQEFPDIDYYQFAMPIDGVVELKIEWIPTENPYGVETDRALDLAYNIYSGEAVRGGYCPYSDSKIKFFLEKGTYTLQVCGNWNTTGNYSFRISTVKQKPVAVKLDKKKITLPVDDNSITASLQYSDGSSLESIGAFTWKSSNKEVARIHNGKKDRFVYKKIGTAIITVSSVQYPELIASCKVQVLFKDVTKKEAYYYTPIYWAAKKGIVADYYNSKIYRDGNYWVGNYFRPDASCTRLQAVTMLWKLAGCPKADAKLADKFPDMKNRKGKSAVAWGIKSGLIKGFEDSTFRPDEPVNRKQAMILLYRLAGKPKVSGTMKFKDVKYKKTSDAYNAILWGTQKKITKGKTSTAFDPNSACARGQIVTFIYRYVKSK